MKNIIGSINRYVALVSVFAVTVLALVVSTPSYAQQGAGSGLRISPVRTELTINPGESKNMTVTLQNVTSADTEYQAIINDFVAGEDELGQPALILDADKYAPSHSLKRYIGSIPNVTIPAGKSKEIKVTVVIPKDASGGGYYGAVRFIPVGGKQGQNITLSASVGSLILVRVSGDIKESVSLNSFDVRKGEDAKKGSSFFASNKNLFAVARFKNDGNSHEQPFGKIQLKKGETVLQTIEINNTTPKGNVLPDSTRRFNVKLDKVGSFGKYTVVGNFGYGANGQLLSGTTSFWVVPVPMIVAVIVLIALLLGAIFGLPKAIKRYNQNVVRKASRRR